MTWASFVPTGFPARRDRPPWPHYKPGQWNWRARRDAGGEIESGGREVETLVCSISAEHADALRSTKKGYPEFVIDDLLCGAQCHLLGG
jgi:hypothetical protein